MAHLLSGVPRGERSWQMSEEKSAPMLIHDTNPPGVATMTRLKSDIRYTIFEIPRGAKLRIET